MRLMVLNPQQYQCLRFCARSNDKAGTAPKQRRLLTQRNAQLALASNAVPCCCFSCAAITGC